MRYLLGTNLLLRLANPADAQHLIARRALRSLFRSKGVVCVVPQVLYEFWVVATRPIERNGLGYSQLDTTRTINRWMGVIKLIDDEPGIHAIWFDLVQRYFVSGKPAHDARLVAAMIKHKIDRLLTFNDADFKRYTEITAESPLSLQSP
jgi:predicted nucleic acid-binding protein